MGHKARGLRREHVKRSKKQSKTRPSFQTSSRSSRARPRRRKRSARPNNSRSLQTASDQQRSFIPRSSVVRKRKTPQTTPILTVPHRLHHQHQQQCCLLLMPLCLKQWTKTHSRSRSRFLQRAQRCKRSRATPKSLNRPCNLPHRMSRPIRKRLESLDPSVPFVKEPQNDHKALSCPSCHPQRCPPRCLPSCALQTDRSAPSCDRLSRPASREASKGRSNHRSPTAITPLTQTSHHHRHQPRLLHRPAARAFLTAMRAIAVRTLTQTASAPPIIGCGPSRTSRSSNQRENCTMRRFHRAERRRSRWPPCSPARAISLSSDPSSCRPSGCNHQKTVEGERRVHWRSHEREST